MPAWDSSLYVSLKSPVSGEAHVALKIRIFFRLIQFSSGDHGASNGLVSHESYFYVLEAVPMAGAILCFLVVHPGTVLPQGQPMPGLWGMIRGRCCAGRKRTGARGEEDGVQLVGKYEELDGEGRPPRYATGGKH